MLLVEHESCGDIFLFLYTVSGTCQTFYEPREPKYRQKQGKSKKCWHTDSADNEIKGQRIKSEAV